MRRTSSFGLGRPTGSGVGPASWPARVRRDERGASMVEFAVILPVFALLLFGMIDFGLVFQSDIGLRNGVNAGAREASVSQTDSSCGASANPMICTVQDRIGSLLGVVPGSVQVNISFANGSGAAGSSVIVSAQASLKSTTGLTAPILDGKTICASSEIRLEQPATYTTGSTGSVSCAPSATASSSST